MTIAALDVPLIARQRARAQREKEAALRIGLGRVLGLGWRAGPVLLVACADARRAETVRKELARLALMTKREGAELLLDIGFADGAAVRVRRAVALSLEPDRLTGDLYQVDADAFARRCAATAALHGARVLDAAARAALIDAELMQVRV